MTITYVIPGATLLDQLSPTTLDGLPNNDASDSCVPTSIAEGLHILTGKTYDGDELKDAVYGPSYVGPMAASHYVAYCASQGVSIAAHNGSQSDLIATIHAQVSAGHPVIVTMPSQWGTAPANPVSPSGSTHVGVAVGVGPGYIRVMNPWHAFWQDQPDSWWQARLCYGQVWPMQKASANVSGVPNGWTDDGTTLKAPNGVAVVHGMRAFVLANSWDASDVPLAAETSVGQVEIGNPSLGAGVVQWFEKSGQLSWVATFNNGNVFRTYNGQEEKALRAALDSAQSNATQCQDRLATATTQLNAAQSQLTTAENAQQTAEQSLTAAQAQITQLQAQIAKLQSQPAPTPTPPAPVANPAPTTPADAAALLVSLIYAEAETTLKAVTPA